MSNERLVALSIELNQLEADRKAFKKGDAGYPLSISELKTLDLRIAQLRAEIAKMEPLGGRKP